MTNRDHWIAGLKDATSREIANMVCYQMNCRKCPACGYSRKGDCMIELERWLEAEHEEEE